MHVVGTIAVVLAGMFCAACGGDDDAPVGDGGPGSDAADVPGIDAAGPRRMADSVVFIPRAQSVQIRFSDDREGPASCLAEPVAGCEIQTCSTELITGSRPDAGLVSVTPAVAVGQSYAPDASGTYPTGPGVTWEDGEEVAVDAAGGAIAAFAVSATGPGDVTSVVAPVFPAPVIRRDEALLVEWTGTESFVAIAIRCAEGEPVQVRCPLPEGTTGQVPVAALQRLPACANATLNVFTEDRHVVEAEPAGPIRIVLRGLIHTTTATVE
jgi:hypothetical protein